KFNFDFQTIPKLSFSHSGTRSKIAHEMYNKGIEFLIFMTQDVILQDFALRKIIEYIKENDRIGMVYGKQEVDINKGNIFEFYARSFNYGNENLIKTQDDIKKYGIKTIFCSDAFAIYNLNIIHKLDYFGNEVNFAEDMIIADKIISNDFYVGY